ncbi:hypothetical protein PC116_g8824 [Phytophthora cactorum]|nr:hypothetical protein PC116_g8824 [Phytophthora cactorum]
MPTSAAPIAFRPCIHYNTVEKFDPDSKTRGSCELVGEIRLRRCARHVA